MINLHFSIRNPWSNNFKNLVFKVFRTPFENKFLELQAYKDTSLLSFHFDWTIRQSHAGSHIEFGILGYCLNFTFYDCRHWNGDLGRWEEHNERKEIY